MEIQVIEPKQILFQKLRVCAYCRVSTEEDEQADSLENQMTHRLLVPLCLLKEFVNPAKGSQFLSQRLKNTFLHHSFM